MNDFVHVSLADGPHILVVNGRTVSFEISPMGQPFVLRKDGEISARQPGERSRFWPAFEGWQAARRTS
ncbi:hypothetical protein SAMN06297251_10478 [Fulvimarina manganoxydans]|uniref:Uncharacterized protein n=1 Tax=Fulvimarina manganoxydans TaxID=937218 RepID=A0A1W2AD50_9HYPH|nr:hypothetical protein [Fulvimarina manganoxydans]SMC58523.1 hypothetical protein SAMN06297251_10478 [Fulvimarina manganoxydans]